MFKNEFRILIYKHKKSIMKNFIILLFITFMISSCTLFKPAFIDSTHDSIYIETYKDTTIYLNDSTYFKAYLKCDSLNNIMLSELSQASGSLIEQEVKYKNNYIYIRNHIDSTKLNFQLKNKTEKVDNIVIKNIVKYQIPKFCYYILVVCVLSIIINIIFIKNKLF